MSRLDSGIRRLQAQRACIDHAAELIRDLPGFVFEFGLGNGRTFDHLRERLAGREIFVFEREIVAHPDCIPSEDHLIRGDLRETLPALAPRFRDSVALLHMDIGSGERAESERLAAELAPHIVPLMRAGALIASDMPLPFRGWVAQPLPSGVDEERYYFYRVL